MAIDLVAVLRLDDQMTANLKSVAVTATAGFAAITAGAVAAVNQFTTFDSAIRKTGAIAGASSAELDSLKDAALDLGASTSKSASEVADSMAELAAAGFEVNDIPGAMPGIIAASEASGESLALAAETVGSALSIWSMKAEESTHVADVLAMAANKSKASINDMAYAFKYAGAPAATLGISLEELAAAVGLITNAGIDGSTAGTSLRTGLMALSSPLEKQQKLMDNIGFSAKGANGETKSLSDMISDLSASLEGMTDATKVGVLKDLVGTEAVSAFLSLVNAGSAELDEFTAALINSDGAAADTANQMMAGIGGALEEMSGAIETVAIRVGERLAPAIVTFAKMVAETNFDPFIEAIGKIGDVAGSIANYISDNWESIAPILVPIAKVLTTIGLSFLAVGGAATVFMALSAAIGFISGPIATIALGISGLVLGFKALYENSESFRNVIDGIKSKASELIGAFKADGVKGVLDAILPEGSVGKLTGIVTSIKNIVGTVVTWLKTKFDEIKPSLQTLATKFLSLKDTVINALSTLLAISEPILSGLWSALQIVGDVASLVFNYVIAPAIEYAIQVIQTLWAVAEPILVLLAGAFEFAFGALKVIWDVVLKPFVEWILGIFKGALELLGDAMKVLGDNFGLFRDVFSNVWDAVVKTAETAVNAVINMINALIDTINNIPLIEIDAVANVNWSGDALGAVGPVNTNVTRGMTPGHYHGLDNVPYDGYVARLHRGETVLNAQEAKERREGQSVNGGNTGGVTITGNTFNVRDDSDIEKIAYQLAKYIEGEALQVG